MIKVVDTLYSKLPAQSLLVPASTTITIGQLLAFDRTNKGLIPATAASTTQSIVGVSTQNVTVGGGATGVVKFVPLDQSVYVVVDTTANTAAAQVGIRHLLTDALTINNTSTDVATNTGVFLALGTVGAASNKKLYGYFIKLGQTT
jgi:hypothetical protein